MLLTLGHWGNSGLDQGLEAQGPVARGPLGLHLQAPCTGALPTRDGAGERGWARWEEVQREMHSGRAEWNPSPLTGPPLLRQHTLNPLQKGLYGLEVAARCAKGAWAHPPALDHERDTLLQKAFLPKSYPE